MDPKIFGPSAWQFMFYVAAGYDFNDIPKSIKDPQYEAFFQSLGEILPCKTCRDSYKKFYSALKIRRYMNLPSRGLIRFVYDIRQLVNKKLLSSETQRLHHEYDLLKEKVSPDSEEFWNIFRSNVQKVCYTKPAPSFKQVSSDLLQLYGVQQREGKVYEENTENGDSIPQSGPLQGLSSDNNTDEVNLKDGKSCKSKLRKKNSKKKGLLNTKPFKISNKTSTFNKAHTHNHTHNHTHTHNSIKNSKKKTINKSKKKKNKTRFL